MVYRLQCLLRRLVQYLLLGAIAFLVLGLTACQPVSDGIIHLTLWHGINPPPNRDVFQALVDDFNHRHPQIQVEAVYVGQGDQQIPKILAATVGNAPPDLLWYAPTLTGRLVELNALRSLEDWYTDDRLAQLDPALEEAIAFEDQLWSVPFGVNNVGLFYRPSLFAAAGVPVPHTWDDLRRAAQQLTDPEAHRTGLRLPLGKGEWTVFMWLPFFWSAGGDWTASPESSAIPNLVTPEAIAALEFWQTLIADGSVSLSSPERGYELDDFFAGRVAMQLTGSWALKEFQAAEAAGIDVAVMPIPQLQRPATAIGGEHLFVFRTTPEREQAALVLVDELMGEAAQTQWAIGTGYLPVNLRSRQSLAYQTFVDDHPLLKVFLDQAAVGRSRPIDPTYPRLSEQLGRAIEAVILQERSPQAALELAQQRLNRVLTAVDLGK